MVAVSLSLYSLESKVISGPPMVPFLNITSHVDGLDTNSCHATNKEPAAIDGF